MLTKLQEIKNNHEEGFTLIELLVVILIIGILAAVAVPMFLNNRKSAVDSTVTSDIKNAVTQVEAWSAKQGAKTSDISLTSNGYTDSLKNIKTSDGTTMVIRGNNTVGYCISAQNDGGADAKIGYVYRSTLGKTTLVDNNVTTPNPKCGDGLGIKIINGAEPIANPL